jgi:hypothetical protein
MRPIDQQVILITGSTDGHRAAGRPRSCGARGDGSLARARSRPREQVFQEVRGVGHGQPHRVHLRTSHLLMRCGVLPGR